MRDKEEHQLGLQDTQLARSAARAVTEREVARLEGEHRRLLKAETLRLTLDTEQKRSELLVDERRRLLDLEHERVRISAVLGCSQMMSAFFGVSDTPWCLCQPIISFWPAPWCLKLTTSFVNIVNICDH